MSSYPSLPYSPFDPFFGPLAITSRRIIYRLTLEFCIGGHGIINSLRALLCKRASRRSNVIRETGIKAEMQLHATDITTRLLSGRAFYFYNVGHASARGRWRARSRGRERGLDTVHNTITAAT